MAGTLALFGLWFAAAHSGLVPARVLPGPDAVILAFWRLTEEPFAGFTLQQHLLSSAIRFGLGFVLAAGVGVPLGLLMGWFRWLDAIVAPVFEALRFIAPIAWVPFAALWFGTGIGGPILIIFSGAFPPCLINAYRGTQLVEPRLIEAARTLGASHWRIIVEVLIPGALPAIVAGLRISAGLGWQSLVGAELIVVSSGIGYLMVQGQSNLATPIVMAGMAAIGLVGFAIDVALRAFEAHIRRGWAG
jgi:NitT/TauT family transport system permease protein